MVDLLASETLDGAAISDSLAGGGTGIDMGVVANQFWTPFIDKVANTGQKDIYLSHDGLNPISNLSVHVGEFGLGTLFAYGGDDTAPNDFTALKARGASSGVSKNNNDGLSEGYWMEMKSDITDFNQFDIGARPTQVKVFGKANEGIDLGTAFEIDFDAMVYNNGGETKASAPVTGQIGPAANTVLGDAAHIRFRFYVKNSEINFGTIQWETIFSFAFSG